MGRVYVRELSACGWGILNKKSIQLEKEENYCG